MSGIEFCNYLQPIVNSCSGFISTQGYMSYTPGLLVMVSADESIFSYIELPLTEPIEFSCYINNFLSLKEDIDKENFLKNIYTIGDNLRLSRCKYFYNTYADLSNNRLYYSEDNCSNIPDFDNLVSLSALSFIWISDGIYKYSIPVSKWITPLTKSDTCKLYIYDCPINRYQESRLLKYIVHKKKFNVDINILANIIMY